MSSPNAASSDAKRRRSPLNTSRQPMSRQGEFKREGSDSELEELEYKYYKELRDGEVKIRGTDKYVYCPYCQDMRGKEYTMQELLNHSYHIGHDSKSSTLRDKCRHLGLLKYLERHTDASGKPRRNRDHEQLERSKHEKDDADHCVDSKDHVEKKGAIAESARTSTRGTSDETFVWPWKAIVANIPVQYKDGRYIGESGQKLKMEWIAKGYNPLKVHPLWGRGGHSGYAIVDFKGDFPGFENVMAFTREFELLKHGKKEWNSRNKDDKLYGWIAGCEDYHSRGLIGNHLSKHGDLKTISEIQNENKRKNSQLCSTLTNKLESKNMKCQEMEKKISKTEVFLGNVMMQKDEMVANYNKALEMMRQNAFKQLETILSDKLKLKQQLEDQRKELMLREDELRNREKLNESEKRKFDDEKEMNEKAIQAKKKADDEMMKLVEEQKRAKEEYHKQIIELQRELDRKQALELQIERLKGDFEVRRHMNEEGDSEAKNKLKSILEELKDKQEELEYVENTYQTLVVHERRINDELQEARKELINGMKGSRANIVVKRMGELDEKPFINAAKQKYSKKEAAEKALELCSQWDAHLRDSQWYPFRVVMKGEMAEEVIKEDDEKLVGLKNEYGDEVYDAVVTALKELNRYNPSGRYPVPELWNINENRRADLREGVDLILKQWKRLKGRKG